MSKLAKIVLSLSLVTLLTAASTLWQSTEANRPETVTCTVDISHNTFNQSGALVGSEVYTNDFVLAEGTPFSDDYSTVTRFKFFDASLSRAGGEATVSFAWFADVSVFNSADFDTTLTLAKGQKTNQSSATSSFWNSNGHSTTTYTLTAARR